MNFSYEEIFSMCGQFDTVVALDFHYNSEAYQTYKPTLMGTFKYTLQEREKLQSLIAIDIIPRTSQYIKFVPSSLEKISPEQKESLDKKGIQNSDIRGLSSLNLPRQNRFIVKGAKDIPNILKIKFNSQDIDLDRLKLGFYNSRLRSGQKLIPEEEFEYIGLQLFLNPDLFNDEFNKRIIDPSTGKPKESIRYYELKAKFFKSSLTQEEDVEFKEFISRRSKIKIEILVEELKRSSEKLKDIAVQYKDTFRTLILLCSQFEDELLLPYDIPIWWDFDHFLHIYVRHVKETKVGERYAEKTMFQYKLRDIRRIVEAVIKSVYDDIREHFIARPTENFRRMGTRSIYFDGIYYRVEIEPTGRLITFHPYNINEEISDT